MFEKSPQPKLNLPDPLSELAKAQVKQMSPSLNPSNLTAEQWLLATAERHTETLRQLEKALDEVRQEQKQQKELVAALGWKVLWALVGIALELVFHGSGLIHH